MLLRALVHAWGGPTKIARMAQEAGFEGFGIQNFVNWRQRGGVPLEYIPRLAELFDVSEYALNFGAVSMQKGPVVSFADAVKSCKVLSPAVRESIVRIAKEGNPKRAKTK